MSYDFETFEHTENDRLVYVCRVCEFDDATWEVGALVYESPTYECYGDAIDDAMKWANSRIGEAAEEDIALAGLVAGVVGG